MNTKEINKGNKLIWEFMGEPSLGLIPSKLEDYKFIWYHSDWNKLIQVIEKICSLDLGKKKQVIFDLYQSSKNAFLQVREQKDNMGYPIIRYYSEEHDNRSFIEHTYYACIEFIKWYNKEIV
jgi:hypothetical protein